MILSRALAAGAAAALALAWSSAASAMSEAEAWTACSGQTAPTGLDDLMQSCASAAGCAPQSAPDTAQIIAGCSAIVASASEPPVRRALAAFQLGSIHALGAAHAQAITDFGAAVGYRPDFFQAYERRAEEYAALRDYPHALADFSQAIKLQPRFLRAYVGRGEAYYEIHDFDHAMADANQAVALKPDNPAALNERCWVRAAAGRDLTAAVADCDRAVALAPGAAGFLDSRGFVHLRMGDRPAAIADYDASLAVSGAPAGVHASSLYGRGLARIASGDRAGGASDLAAAKALDSDVARPFAQAGLRP